MGFGGIKQQAVADLKLTYVLTLFRKVNCSEISSGVIRWYTFNINLAFLRYNLSYIKRIFKVSIAWEESSTL